jgi:hypothetical protein
MNVSSIPNEAASRAQENMSGSAGTLSSVLGFNGNAQDYIAHLDLIAIVQFTLRSLDWPGYFGFLILGAVANALAVDEGAIATAQITDAHCGWVDVEQAVMPGNIDV